MKFPAACPEIPVDALAPALAYYRDCLGFSIDWSDEELGLAGLSQGASRLFMGAAHYRVHLETGGRPIVIWLNLSSRAEVDELHARWTAAGAKLDLPPAAKPYKLYEFLAFDLDGNILRVFYDFAWEERKASGTAAGRFLPAAASGYLPQRQSAPHLQSVQVQAALQRRSSLVSMVMVSLLVC